MEITTKGGEMFDHTATSQAEREWDWESRKSGWSTVADPDDESYCEGCDSEVDYSDGSKYGKCKCENH